MDSLNVYFMKQIKLSHSQQNVKLVKLKKYIDNIGKMKTNIILQPYPISCYYSMSRYLSKREMSPHTFIILFREFLDVLAFP